MLTAIEFLSSLLLDNKNAEKGLTNKYYFSLFFQSLGQEGRRAESGRRLSELHQAGQEEEDGQDGQDPPQTVTFSIDSFLFRKSRISSPFIFKRQKYFFGFFSQSLVMN